MYGFRQIKNLFAKMEWTIVIVICSTVIVCLNLYHISKHHLNNAKGVAGKPAAKEDHVNNANGVSGEPAAKEDHVNNANGVSGEPAAKEDHVNNANGVSGEPAAKEHHVNNANGVSGEPAAIVKYYDVLLSSYMRSGSSLAGIILGWRDDSFYMYEPLMLVSRWTYWQGNNTVCRLDRPDCMKTEPDTAILDDNGSTTVSLVMTMKILRKLYDCLFTDFERPGLMVSRGGPNWNQIADCIKDMGNRTVCVRRFAPQKCKNAVHRVTKVLRLTTDLLGDLLKERNNLKVIHLFRDPRAIMNSRIHTSWITTNEETQIIADAKSLCNKMLYDTIEGKKLLKLYPDRFKFIFYEDLNENPIDKVKAMYKYLGMSLDEKNYSNVISLPVFKKTNVNNDRTSNTAFWWRMSMKWDLVQKIDDICKDVYKELGYEPITKEEEFRNMSVRSVVIPNEYLLV